MSETEIERPKKRSTDDPIIKRVREVADDLLNGKLKAHPDERKDLRDALDKADAPLTGRAATDAAIGRINRRGV